MSKLLAAIEPPASLVEAVVKRIARARRRGARARFALASIAALASGAALVTALEYALREFYASGFYDYMALFVTDPALAQGYTRDLLYSLAESLPSLAVLALLGAVALLAWALTRAVRDSRAAFTALPMRGSAVVAHG